MLQRLPPTAADRRATYPGYAGCVEHTENPLPLPSLGNEWREHQQRRVTAWFDVSLSVLALVMVVLLVIELAAPLSAAWASRLARAQVAIWGVFVAAFLI
jgi:hypothetical protein